MAIVKMKHLRLVAMNDDREELFQLLQRMGCVEIDAPDVDPEDPVLSKLTRSVSKTLSPLKEEQTGAEHALTVLKRFAPEKGGLMRPRPEVSEAEFFDEDRAEKARQGAREINEGEKRLQAIQSERLKCQTQKEALTPWLELDLPLDVQSTPTVTIQLGTLPGAADFDKAAEAVSAVGELSQLTRISQNRDFHYCLLVCHASQAEAVLEALKERGVKVDPKLPALPQAMPAPLPKEQMAYAGYYGSNLQQMKVDVRQDGTLTIHSLTVPSTPEQVFRYCADGFFRDQTGTVLVNFVQESNGETYLYQKTNLQLPGLGSLPVSNYLAQKMKENPVSKDAQDAWLERMTMDSVLLNEKYSSQIWPMLFTATQLPEVPEMVPGYSGALRIIDKDHIRSELQIPNNVGRDSQDVSVYEVDGVTYLSNQSQIFMDASAVRPIYSGTGAYTTIQPDGYARWYKVGGEAGSTMSVTVPEDAGFYVYQADGTVAASSLLYGDRSAVLPKDGFIVFLGDPGDRFGLSFTPAAK